MPSPYEQRHTITNLSIEIYRRAYDACGGADPSTLISALCHCFANAMCIHKLPDVPTDEMINLAQEMVTKEMTNHFSITKSSADSPAPNAAPQPPMNNPPHLWKGKLRHSRQLMDDWGYIRDEDYRLIFIVRPDIDDVQAAEHRRNKTDPTQDRVDALLAAFTIVQHLAEWSKRYPRQQVHSFSAKVDEQLIDIENAAKAWMNGQKPVLATPPTADATANSEP